MLSEFDADEFEEIRRDTKEQLREFQQVLERSVAGDLSLVDEFGSVQLVMCLIVIELKEIGILKWMLPRLFKLQLVKRFELLK